MKWNGEFKRILYWKEWISAGYIPERHCQRKRIIDKEQVRQSRFWIFIEVRLIRLNFHSMNLKLRFVTSLPAYLVQHKLWDNKARSKLNRWTIGCSLKSSCYPGWVTIDRSMGLSLSRPNFINHSGHEKPRVYR